MTNFLVRLVSYFNPIWRKLGVNPDHLEAILRVKLKMDGRRASAFNANAKGTKKENKGQDWLTMLMFFLFGALFLSMFAVLKKPVSAFTVYFAAWMVTLAMTLITDFTEVLIDVRDNYILLPRPVNDRTITISRILHVILYLSKLALAYAIPGIIFMAIAYGVGGVLVFLLQFSISIVFVIFLVNLIYLVILRYTSAQKFKEIINYFQIAFTVLIFASYYLLPRLIDFSAFSETDVLTNSASYFVPPAWIAGLWGLIMEGDTRIITLIISAFALLTPIICTVFVTNVMAKNFSQKMMALGQGSSETKKSDTPKTLTKNPWLHRISKSLTGSSIERASFEWVWQFTQRNREFKLKVYPGLAFVPIFFIYFALNGEGSLAERFANMSSGKYYLLLIYFCLLLLTSPLQISSYSNQYKTSWILRSRPIPYPGEILSGSFKAIVLKFFFPIYILMLVISISIWGFQVIDDFLLGFFNIALIGLIMQRNQKKLPFSSSLLNLNKGEGFMTAILTMMFAGLLGGVHYLLTYLPILVPISVVVMAIICWGFLREFRKLKWEQIQT